MEFESKEFDLRLKQLDAHAEHLRTIHFTLLITVFVVLVGAFMTRRPDYTRAIEQIDSIRWALKVTTAEGTVSNRKSDWDPQWLDRNLYASLAGKLFPSLVLDSKDFEAFLAQLDRGNAYQLFGHAFTIEQTPNGISVERLYAKNPGGPLFYLDSALESARRPGRQIIPFFYPHIHFADIPLQSTNGHLSEIADADVAFLAESAIDAYKVLRTRPRNLSEFQAFWSRLSTLRVQLPSLADGVDSFIALIVRRPEDSGKTKPIVEVVSCKSVRVEHGKVPWFPNEAAPIGLALSTYYLDNAPKDIEFRLAAADLPCNMAPYATVNGSTIHWRSGYYAYVDPFHSFQSKFSDRNDKRWFILQFPLGNLEWRSLDGVRLFDPRLSSLSGLDFKDAFPDLAKLAKRLGDLNWGDLRTVIEDQSIKQSETVSVLGVSVPLALLFLVGTLAILAIQTYMIACMSQFISLANRYPSAFKAQNFPWIGLPKDLIWNIVTVMTVSVFPFTVILSVGVTTFAGGVDLIHVLVGAFALVLEITVAIWLALGFRKLRSLPRSAGSLLVTSEVNNSTPDLS